MKKGKKGKKGASSASAQETRKSARSSARRSHKEEQSSDTSSDPEIESDVGNLCRQLPLTKSSRSCVPSSVVVVVKAVRQLSLPHPVAPGPLLLGRPSPLVDPHAVK